MLDVALGLMTAKNVEENGTASYVVSAVLEHLRAWRWKKVIFRIDGEPAIRALGVSIQHARSVETVIVYKELCGLMRCFRIYLRESEAGDPD